MVRVNSKLWRSLEVKMLLRFVLEILPYSGNLSQMKTYVNVVVLEQFAKVLTAKILIGVRERLIVIGRG